MILDNAYLKLGSDDVSSYLRSLTAPVEVEGKDDTAMGATARSQYPGLTHDSLQAEFNQSFTSGELDDIISALLGSTFTIEWHPDGATVGANNPKWTGTAVIVGYQRVGQTVGDQATCSVSIEGSGGTKWARATS